MFRVTLGRFRTVFVSILTNVIIVWALPAPGRSVDHDSQAGVVPTQRRHGSSDRITGLGGVGSGSGGDTGSGGRSGSSGCGSSRGCGCRGCCSGGFSRNGGGGEGGGWGGGGGDIDSGGGGGSGCDGGGGGGGGSGDGGSGSSSGSGNVDGGVVCC